MTTKNPATHTTVAIATTEEGTESGISIISVEEVSGACELFDDMFLVYLNQMLTTPSFLLWSEIDVILYHVL